MTKKKKTASWREHIRPVELVAMALAVGIFTWLVITFATRNIGVALIFGGVAFVVSLIFIAILVMSIDFKFHQVSPSAPANVQLASRVGLGSVAPEDSDIYSSPPQDSSDVTPGSVKNPKESDSMGPSVGTLSVDPSGSKEPS